MEPPGCVADKDPQRDAWRQARKHINEYEQKASERQLDLQQEQKAHDAMVHELQRIRQEAAGYRNNIDQLRAACLREQTTLMDVMSGCVAEGTEGARLVAHLKEWRAKMDAVLDEMTCGRLAREKHLREQTQHVVETEEGLVLLTTGARC